MIMQSMPLTFRNFKKCATEVKVEMNKLAIIFVILSTCFFPTSLDAQGTGLFHTEEERIIDAEGKVFIIHGANIPGPRFSWKIEPSVAHVATKMEAWGMNGVRVAWRRFQSKTNDPCDHPVKWNQNKNAPIEEYIREFVVKRGMVMLITSHDWYGSDLVDHPCASEKIRQMMVGLARAFGTQSSRTGVFTAGEAPVKLTDEQASRIWFDVRNEPINGTSASIMKSLKKDYDKTVSAIRNLGAENIIVLEGSRWGRDSGTASKSWIKTHGPYFRDKYDNIAFSHHSYGWTAANENNPDYGNLEKYYQWMIDNNMPIINGELSREEGGIEVTRYAYGEVNDNWLNGGFETNGANYKKGIGILYWSFWGGDDADLTTSENGGGHHIIFKNGTPTNLTEEGKIVYADIRRGDKKWPAPCGGDGCN